MTQNKRLGLLPKLVGLVFIVVSLPWFNPQGRAQLLRMDTLNWSFSAGLNFRQNGGNFKRAIWIPEFKLSHVSKSKRFGFSTNNRYTWGNFGPVLTENDLLSRNFLYLNPTANHYPYLMIWGQTHRLSRLNQRLAVGLGYSVNVLNTPNHLLKLSGTAAYETNQYDITGLTVLNDGLNLSSYTATRGIIRFYGQHKFGESNISLNYEFYFQPDVQNFSNIRYFADGGINFPIWKGFSTRLMGTYEYSTVHARPNLPEDWLLAWGLNYQFSKK